MIRLFLPVGLCSLHLPPPPPGRLKYNYFVRLQQLMDSLEHFNFISTGTSHGPSLLSVKRESISGRSHIRAILRVQSGTQHDLLPASILGDNPGPSKIAKVENYGCWFKKVNGRTSRWWPIETEKHTSGSRSAIIGDILPPLTPSINFIVITSNNERQLKDKAGHCEVNVDRG
ncbi:unnamed protein product [Cyprideis torosa]|uniref:Uncharacterized protein n=1 Tax=Cyprideis torosa TaxID=163714 RepID=A0A7R8ZLU4_9CRUS|nr:unnamed protein product [Cyprideis torosa]CAG0882911.1 unnamed protein product [Cyprideis torosa]